MSTQKANQTTKRNLDVQTPGAPAATPVDQTQSTDKGVQAAVDASLTDSTLGTNRAETGNTGVTEPISNQNQPEPELAPAAPARQRITSEQYKAMRADDIDPNTLTAPVLSADGWVTPTPKEQK